MYCCFSTIQNGKSALPPVLFVAWIKIKVILNLDNLATNSQSDSLSVLLSD